MPIPLDNYNIKPALLKGLFDNKTIRIKTAPAGRLQTGTLNVITEGEDHASMTVLLYAAPNQNQFAQVQAQGSRDVTPEMLDKVVVENGGQGFFADWSAF